MVDAMKFFSKGLESALSIVEILRVYSELCLTCLNNKISESFTMN